MADDLNTPEALAALFTLISDLNAQDDHVALTREERDAVLAFLDEADAIFAAWPHEEASLDAEVEALIEARRAAKAAKNWAEADRVRDHLKAMGIVLEDRKDGTVGWRRA
jgi:cysteinyl-tRNA synthetase